MNRGWDERQAEAFKIRRDRLIRAIEQAFGDVKRLDGITLHEAMVLDDYGSTQEQAAARLLDPEDRWQAVSDQTLVDCYSALSFLDPPGFRFYLPAFMRAGLRQFHPDPHGIRSACEFHLTRDRGKSLRKSDPAEMVAKYGFTLAQVQAIAQFLRLTIDFTWNHEGAVFEQAVARWEALANRRG
ncbi:MAG: hypothetical protein HC812_15930 [Leptolyngbya sp. RL_3_1]|nr:hypothetical protein [Leptolyngbya sp. RL_3_1]